MIEVLGVLVLVVIFAGAAYSFVRPREEDEPVQLESRRRRS